MFKVLHCSAECYPYAKVGGLADVAGSLPKYQTLAGMQSMLIMPMHRTAFLYAHGWDVVFKGDIQIGRAVLSYTIIKEQKDICGFELYAVDLHGLLDREKVYGYDDDAYRFLAFQLCVVNWVASFQQLPEVIHLHDHHTAIIPFILRYTNYVQKLGKIKTVLTIHNAQYQGIEPWSFTQLLPWWDHQKTGLLEWDDQFNALACGIRCADNVNTVSKTYMQELMQYANGLEKLFEYEKGKCTGIVNGIDHDVWNPETDVFIHTHYDVASVKNGKQKNKENLCTEFGFDHSLPLFIFIGRLVYDKSADLLPAIIEHSFSEFGYRMNWLLLGSGDFYLEEALKHTTEKHHSNVEFVRAYNEPLSHRMYASADFLLMPSRIEPCGLNQLYAMRYGTVPMVRRTGGLQDTVIDIGDEGGYGICFNHAEVGEILHAIDRALYVYQDADAMHHSRNNMMKINHSWQQTVQEYSDLYNY